MRKGSGAGGSGSGDDGALDSVVAGRSGVMGSKERRKEASPLRCLIVKAMATDGCPRQNSPVVHRYPSSASVQEQEGLRAVNDSDSLRRGSRAPQATLICQVHHTSDEVDRHSIPVAGHIANQHTNAHSAEREAARMRKASQRRHDTVINEQ